MKKTLFAVICSLSIGLCKLNAQVDTTQWSCGHAPVLDSMLADPAFSARMVQLRAEVKEWIANNNTLTNTIYTIPVVFHVLHDAGNAYGAGTNVSLQQIKWQLNALNVAFANEYQNYTFQTSPGPHAVNTQIKFCLATIPEGTIGGTPVGFYFNPTTSQTECGVMRYPLSGADLAALHHDMDNLTASQQDLLDITHAPPGGANLFPFEHYLNIWLVEDICSAIPVVNCNTIGYATFPNQGGTFDGIVFRADVIGDNSITLNNFNMLNVLDQGKIMVHEAGHYLGLYHTFHPGPINPIGTGVCAGDLDNNCATSGDFICDTPPTSITGNPGAGTYNTCTDNLSIYSNSDQNDMVENFMSYSDDNMMNTFTNGQAQVMQAILSSPTGRADLVSPANLATVGVSNGPVCDCAFEDGSFSYQYQLNPCNSVAFLVPVAASLSPGYAYSWDFGDGTTGLGMNPVHTYTTTGTYTVSLTIDYPNTNQTVQTATISITNIDVAIASRAAGQICNGSPQQLTLTFQNATAPVNFIITDGYTTLSGTATNTLINGDVTAEVYYNADINFPTFTVINVSDPTHCGRNPNEQINLTIIDCCANLIVNGDFEAGNTGFTSDNIISCTSPPPGTLNYGYASVHDIDAALPNTVSCTSFGAAGSVPAIGGFRNAVFLLDGRVGNTVAGAANTLGFANPVNNAAVTSILWEQTNVPLVNGEDYNIDLFIRSPNGGGGNTPITPFRVRLDVFDNSGSGVPVFSSTNFDLPKAWDFMQYSFVCPNFIGITGPSTVRLSQVQFFDQSFYDPGIDDISIRRTDVPAGGGTAYAGADLSTCGGNVTLSGSGNPAYTWSPGATLSSTTIAQPVATPTATTTYTLSVNNGCGVSTDEVTITVLSAPSSPTITATSTVVCSSGSSSVLNVTNITGAVVNWYTVGVGGTPIYTGNPFPTPTLTTTTTYYAEYQFGQCFSARSNITLTAVSNPTVTVTPTTQTVCLGTPAAMTASGASTYSWGSSGSLSPSTGATVNALPGANTTYTVVGTDANGCEAIATATVVVGPAPTVTVSPGNANLICLGQSLVLTASGATTYLWDATLGSVTTNTVSVSPVSNTTYTLQTTDPGCSLGTTLINVLVGGTATLTVTPSSATICAGSSVVLTANGGTATYTWTPSGSLSAANTPTVTASPTVTTTYTVENSEVTTGCKLTGTATVTVTSPTVSVNASAGSFCTGGSGVTLTAGGALTYTWSPGTGLSATSGATVTAAPSSTTIYTVTGTDAGGCTNAATITVTVNPLPSISAGALPSVICAGQASTISATTGLVSYSWSPGGATTYSTNVSPISNTTYTVTGTDANGCQNTATTTVTVNPLPTFTVNASPSTVCTGQASTLTATAGFPTYFFSGIGSIATNTVTAIPSSSGPNYTVTVTDANGCQNSNTLSVTVNPLPTLTVTATSNTVCAGAATTLTASGANTYTLMPSTAFTTTVSVSPTLTPTSTYTVQGTNTSSGCVGSITKTITVNALPSLTVTATSNTVCAGTATTLTASGANTYTLMPSTAFTTTVSVSPTVTTTYTVQGTNTSTGCVGSTTKIITVDPVPTLTVTPASYTYCPGTPVNITASGSSTSYSWSPGTGLSATTGATVTATPTVSTNYTVTGTGSNGCTSTAVSSFSVAANSCYNSTQTVSATTFTAGVTNFGYPALPYNSSIAVLGNIVFSAGTSTINISQVNIFPGVSITVQSGATLIIDASYLHSCVDCEPGMWLGIQVEKGGTLEIRNGSRIEDAINAVSTLATGTGTPALNISTTIFNKNNTGIYLNNTATGNLQSGGAANVIDNTIFTCRSLPAAPTSTVAATSLFNTIKADLYSTTPTYSVTDTKETGSARSDMGIRLNIVTYTVTPYTIGEAGATGAGGAGPLNIFDNLNFGINTAGGSVWSVKNALFQNAAGNNGTLDGSGIWAGGGNVSVGCMQAAATVANEGCIFRNLLRGVHLNNVGKAYVRNNAFDNSTTSTSFGSNATGEYGIWFKPQGSSTAVGLIDGNTIYNCATAIHVNRSANYQSAGISITSNYITAAGTGSQYCDNGILLEDAVGSTQMTAKTYLVQGNTITNIEKKVIRASNIQSGLDIICNNELSLRYRSTGGTITNGSTFDVIRLDNCKNSYTEFNNTICTAGGNTAVANEALTGIYVNNFGAAGSNNVLDNNTIRYLGTCMAWEGTNPSGTLIRRNYMNNARYGLYMNNAAAFNTQSADNVNKWGTVGALNITTNQTFNNNGTNVNGTAIFNVWTGSAGTGLTYAPTSHAYNAGTSPNAYSTGAAITNGFITTTVTPTPCTNCDSPCPPGGGSFVDGGDGGEENLLVETENEDGIPELKAALENTLNDTIQTTQYNTERKWVGRKWVFENLYYNPSLYDGNTTLQDFYEETKNEPIGMLTKVEDYITGGQFSDAQTMLNDIHPNNIMEQYLTELYQLNLNSLLDTVYVYSVVEIERIFGIASGCELRDGPAVLKARTQYNAILESYIPFENTCTEGDDIRLARAKETIADAQKFNVYPNPSNGEITFEVDAIKENEKGIVTVYALDGKIVAQKELSRYANTTKLSLKDLQNGVYICKFVKNGIVMANERLVIMK